MLARRVKRRQHGGGELQRPRPNGGPMKKATANCDHLGVIVANACYSLDAFQKLTGLGRSAIRTCRRQGFRVLYVSNRAFVLGRDWIAFVDKHGSTAFR